MTASNASAPLVTFYCVVPGAPEPCRADRSLRGSMPLRAFQHCEPMAAASAFGWYVFPPVDFALMWDGAEVFWKASGSGDWKLVEAVVLPGYADAYARSVPRGSRVPKPFPFLMARRETGLVQIWPGILVRTRPGWSTHVRGPANLPHSHGYDVLEGIIETDWWFGPLISSIRLTRTGRPVVFRKRNPLFQLQPIETARYASDELDDFRVKQGLSAMTAEDWRRYETTIHPPDERPGIYAAHVRKRRRAGGARG